AENALHVIVEGPRPDLPVVEQTQGRALQGRERRGQRPPLAFGLESRIQHSDAPGTPPPQVARVTASDFTPYHAATTPPPPPPAPPAATTSRSSGERRAVYPLPSSRRPAPAALPTDRHSARRTRAPSNTYSRISRFPQPAAAITSRCCLAMITA